MFQKGLIRDGWDDGDVDAVASDSPLYRNTTKTAAGTKVTKRSAVKRGTNNVFAAFLDDESDSESEDEQQDLADEEQRLLTIQSSN